MPTRYIALLLISLSAAVGLPVALAETTGAGADPFGGWGAVLSSSPVVVLLGWVLREVMAANRAREIDAKEREAAARAHELRIEEMRTERDKEMATAMADLGAAVRSLTNNCAARGRDYQQTISARGAG